VCENGQYVAKNVLVTVGGAAAPALGGSAEGYRLLTDLGCEKKPLFPSIVQVRTATDYVRAVKGIRVDATVTLRIDGREMSLCFHVANEAQHSALAGKSDCCVIYLKLSRPGEKAACGICAVVTAGNVSPLYVGRNGVFYDRDGKDWEAVVTKVVENQVSLAEAFWMPWKKVGAGIAGAVKKFLGDKQAAGERNLGSLTAKVPEDAKNKSGGNGSVAMASSLAAIGVSVGLVGAALASVMAAVRDFAWWQYPLSVLVAILVVSLPSVVLTYFKLRRRDLGAILNASGWAVNRKLYFSMKLAAGFTKCARRKCRCALWWWLFAVLAVGIAAALWRWHCGCCCA
jgi:hypothetical protein